ncbi:hypothetical protein I553_10222 [Mycobacterium xenopi 4042]|uniref:Uncharacterized protein n=1 Tax=Mycobacterium xenopi 4042 TaxID=1299334 RepID=X7ZKJ2_MYCXE|nr:hypothetical protein I553_10222 [Mycobacterium xenopi 4042]
MLGVTRTPAMERPAEFRRARTAGRRPRDVAREGLEQLPHGPVYVAAVTPTTWRAATTRTGESRAGHSPGDAGAAGAD